MKTMQDMSVSPTKGGRSSPARYPELPILVVDDETPILESCKLALNYGGIDNVICVQDSRNIMSLLEKHRIGFILLDLAMPHASGEDLITLISQEYPEIQIIVLAGFNKVENAVDCMRKGVVDYLVKPVEKNRLISSVKRAIDLWEARNENRVLKRRLLAGTLEHPEAFSEIVTDNPRMHSVFEYVETIAPTCQPVLITGDTGVGKELIAKSIHKLSKRKGPLVTVNVAGLDDQMLSDTLFGHVKGAFTGANAHRTGLIERANGGTLFLDEIGDMTMTSQVKLLRLVQEGEYIPLGADVPKISNARIIAVTNRDIEASEKAGGFRRDLYYRLNIHQVHIASLRERLGDLPLLVDRFLDSAAAALNKRKPTPPDELITLLATYHFPGNVRELEAMVFDAVSRHKGRMLSLDTFKSHVYRKQNPKPAQLSAKELELLSSRTDDQPPTIKEAIELLILNAMVKTNGNQAIAADLLGITRSALSKRLRRAGLDKVPVELS